MECKEAQQLVKAYIDGEIRDKELDKFLEHIENCKDCYEELEINYTIFSALMKLDDNPNLSYNINAMLQDELKASRKYIRRRKRFKLCIIAIYIITIITMIVVLAVQFKIWFT